MSCERSQPGLAAEHRLQRGPAIVLAAAGYRPAREAHHYRVIQSLAYTIAADAAIIAQFDVFRKKRNIAGYECMGTVSNKEADEMFALAKRLRQDVEAWLRAKCPNLIRG